MQNPCLYKKWRDTLSYNFFSEKARSSLMVANLFQFLYFIMRTSQPFNENKKPFFFI